MRSLHGRLRAALQAELDAQLAPKLKANDDDFLPGPDYICERGYKWDAMKSRLSDGAARRPEILSDRYLWPGASDGIRTHDLLFTKQLLYP